MKKFLTSVFTAFICAAMLFSVSVSAEPDIDIIASKTVYCTPADQDYVYDLLTSITPDDPVYTDLYYHDPKDDQIKPRTIVKESISPVYYMDILEYAETGKAEFKFRQESESYGAFYLFFLNTLTEDGSFGGVMHCYIYESGRISLSNEFSPATYWAPEPLERYNASCSYADHAERIRDMLGLEDIVPPSEVKLIRIGGPTAFYINHDGKEYVAGTGDVYVQPYANLNKKNQITEFCGERFNARAQRMLNEHIEHQKMLDEYYKTHDINDPNQILVGGGSGGVSGMGIGASLEECKNIVAINEYLKMDQYYDGTEKGIFPLEKGVDISVYLIAGGAAVILAVGVATAVLIFKKRAEKR